MLQYLDVGFVGFFVLPHFVATIWILFHTEDQNEKLGFCSESQGVKSESSDLYSV